MGISPFSKLQSEFTANVTIPGSFQNLENYNKILCYTTNSIEVLEHANCLPDHGSNHNQPSCSPHDREHFERCTNNNNNNNNNVNIEENSLLSYENTLEHQNTKLSDIEYKLEHYRSLDSITEKLYHKKKQYVFEMLNQWDNDSYISKGRRQEEIGNKSVNVLFEARERKSY